MDIYLFIYLFIYTFNIYNARTITISCESEAQAVNKVK